MEEPTSAHEGSVATICDLHTDGIETLAKLDILKGNFPVGMLQLLMSDVNELMFVL
jgi:hypothetical protein